MGIRSAFESLHRVTESVFKTDFLEYTSREHRPRHRFTFASRTVFLGWQVFKI